jgi:hypothetical protein
MHHTLYSMLMHSRQSGHPRQQLVLANRAIDLRWGLHHHVHDPPSCWTPVPAIHPPALLLTTSGMPMQDVTFPFPLRLALDPPLPANCCIAWACPAAAHPRFQAKPKP